MNTIFRTDKNAASGNVFTRIDNRVIDDTSLTPTARLALVYLLSRPDDWIVQDRDLRRYLEVGIKKLQSVIQELRDAGYLDRQQRKNDQGRWYTTMTLVFEHPDLKSTAGQESSNGKIETVTVGQKLSNGKEPESAKNSTVGQKPSRRLPSDGNGSDGNGGTVTVQSTNNRVTNDESLTTKSTNDGADKQHAAVAENEGDSLSLFEKFWTWLSEPYRSQYLSEYSNDEHFVTQIEWIAQNMHLFPGVKNPVGFLISHIKSGTIPQLPQAESESRDDLSNRQKQLEAERQLASW